MEYNRAQLKRSVKLSIKTTSSRPMVTALLFTMVVSAGSWLINTVLGALLTGGVGSISDSLSYYLLERGMDIDEAVRIIVLDLLRQGPGAIFGAIVGGTVLSVIVTLWQSAMNVGYKGWCLSMVRGENPPLGQIFCAMPRFGPVLLTRFLTELFVFLWSLLVVAAYIVVVVIAAVIDVPALTILLVVLATIAAVLGVIWVSMRYVLVDFVLLDKNLIGMDAIRESKRLMQGRIKNGYILDLSFFNWYLLELAVVYGGVMLALAPIIAAAGSLDGLVAASGFALLVAAAVTVAVAVLSLWLRPYITGSWAKFYDFAQGRGAGPDLAHGSGPDSGGWGEHTGYTWKPGQNAGTGMGPGPRNDNPPPRKPRDDPWN